VDIYEKAIIISDFLACWATHN